MNNTNSVYSVGPRTPFSNFNLNRVFRGSVSPCVGLPVYWKHTIPNSKMQVSYRHMLQTLPLTSPVFGDASITFSWYWLSWYSCIPAIRDSIFRAKLSDIKIPNMFLPASRDIVTEFRNISGTENLTSSVLTPVGLTSISARRARSVNPGSIMEYFGIPIGMVTTGQSSFTSSEVTNLMSGDVLQTPGQKTCAIPYFMYYSIFYHHRANLQDPNFYVLLGDSNSSYSPTVTARPIATLQRYLNYACNYSADDAVALDGYHALALTASRTDLNNSAALFPDLDGRALLGRNCGLWCSPARPDYFTSFVSAVNYNVITAAGSVKISEGLFTVDSLILAQALRRFNAYESYGNGTFLDMLYSLYEAKPTPNGMTPVFLGRDSAPFNFQSIFATSSEGLGDLGGRGSTGSNFRSRRYGFDNYGTLMCIAEIRPHVSYFQGRLDGNLQFLTDIPSGILDTNDLVPSSYAENYAISGSAQQDGTLNISIPAYVQPRGTITGNNNPAVNVYGAISGYRPRFASWKTDVDRLHGDLTGSLANWAFGRSFGYNPNDPQDASLSSVGRVGQPIYALANPSYLSPYVMNRVFTDTSNGAQNFILSIDFQIKAKLPLYRPNFAEL